MPIFEVKLRLKCSKSVIWKVRGGIFAGIRHVTRIFYVFWTKRFFNVYIPGVGVAPINIGWGATLPKNSLIFEGKWRQKWSKSVIWKVRGQRFSPSPIGFFGDNGEKGGRCPANSMPFFEGK